MQITQTLTRGASCAVIMLIVYSLCASELKAIFGGWLVFTLSHDGTKFDAHLAAHEYNVFSAAQAYNWREFTFNALAVNGLLGAAITIVILAVSN